MIKFICVGADDLCKPQIIEAARNHKLILLADTNGEEDRVLIKKAVKLIRSCWEYVRPGIDLNMVHIYVNAILDAEPEVFRAMMTHERRCTKYICEIVGAMLKHGVFQCSTNVLAKKIAEKTNKSYCTIERYIYEGVGSLSFNEIFSEVDTKITNNQYDLCARFETKLI